MNPKLNPHAPSSGTVPGGTLSGPREDIDPHVQASIRDVFGTFQATGVTEGAAWGLVADVFGVRDATLAFTSGLTVDQDPAAVMAKLDAIGDARPELAVEAFRVACRAWANGQWCPRGHFLDTGGAIRRWLPEFPEDFHAPGGLGISESSTVSLPRGLTVDGMLLAVRCRQLATLPEGLHVGSDLWLSGCASLERLPPCLVVQGNLFLCGGLDAWDGRIPLDAWVGGSVYTSAYMNGIPLAAWRRQA